MDEKRRHGKIPHSPNHQLSHRLSKGVRLLSPQHWAEAKSQPHQEGKTTNGIEDVCSTKQEISKGTYINFSNTKVATDPEGISRNTGCPQWGARTADYAIRAAKAETGS